MNRDHDADTSKEVHSYPLQYVGYNSEKVVMTRNSSEAPEIAPPSGLEVNDHYKRSTVEVSKPLPLPPTYEEESTTAPKSTWRRPSKKLMIIVAVVALVAIVAIVVGAVVGTRNSGGDNEASEAETSTSTSTSTSSSATASASSTAVAIPSEEDVEIGTTLSASFTYYGSGDSGDGDSCLGYSNACGILTNPGFSVQVSENLYGEGITCGTCWRLDAEHDDSGTRMNSSIIAMVNEMCPALGYPVCGQRDLESENLYDAQVHFNLCVDTGASNEFFGNNSGIGLAMGTVTRVDCDDWDGTMRERTG